MIAIVARRLVALPPILVATSLLMFLLLSMGPSPMAHLQEFGNLSADELARIAHERGYDRPLLTRYLDWFTSFFTGDWGVSMRTSGPASQLILERLPLTLWVSSLALFFSVGIGLPVGAYVAVRKYSRVDYATTLLTLLMMASPAFFLALVMQLGAVQLKDATGSVVFYTSGIPDDGGLVAWAQRLALPVLTLTMTHIAIWVRYQRGELLNVLGQEYVRAAQAKGIPGRLVFMRHAMRNAMLPIITLIALDMGKLVAGAVVIESVFGLPGVGTLFLESVVGGDTTVVLDILMLIAVTMVLSNMVADVLYGVLDPRVREE